MTGKRLASDFIDHVVSPNQLGTIFVWIPRFGYNDNGDIKYIKEFTETEEYWKIPEIFTYRQKETAPDFISTGVWMETKVDNQYSTKITQMNQEDSVYGFIKTTLAMATDQTTQNEFNIYYQKLIENNTELDTFVGIVNNITNKNRIILKIMKAMYQDPIKANGIYNKETGLIEINVTYSKFGIDKILF